MPPQRPPREHSDYLGRHKRLPLQLLTTLTREVGLFTSLRRSVPKTKARGVRENAWILETPWTFVDERVFVSQDPARDQSLIQRLGRAIAASLKGDWRQRVEEAGEEVNKLLGSDPPLHQEASH